MFLLFILALVDGLSLGPTQVSYRQEHDPAQCIRVV